jgi:hypothetical protein
MSSSLSAEINTFNTVNELIHKFLIPDNIIICKLFIEEIKYLITNNTHFNKDEKDILSEKLLSKFKNNNTNDKEFIQELYDNVFKVDEKKLIKLIELKFIRNEMYQLQFKYFLIMLHYINL